MHGLILHQANILQVCEGVLNYARSRNPICARTYAETNPSARGATQLRSVLARVCSVSRQNPNTTTVP
jgi:hypothetical protein